MTGNYWANTMQRQISRRRALVATGAGAFGAAFLAACGGSDKGGGSKAPLSGLITTPVDTTAQAKPGATYRSTISVEPPSIDPIGSGYNPGIVITANYAYPRLLKWKVAKYPELHKGEVEGDLAESFELSPDKLTMTFKLRQGLKWDLPSGRTIDGQDVLFSWAKTKRESRFAALTDNATSPDAPITSLTSPDANTIVAKLARPTPSMNALLASYNLMLVMPREADGGFDPKKEIRGYGPWNFVSWRASQSITYKKNPDYYVKGRPFFDGVEIILMPEYAARMAQFRAGSLWTNIVQPQDVLMTKKDLPELLLTQADAYALNNPNIVTFGYEGDSQFKDQRVRQAFNMLIDRDASADALTSSDLFRAEGIDVDLKTNTIFSANYIGFWLDPLNEKEFGPNAKYFKHDVAEAKKLMAAAGFANGFDTSYVCGATSNLTQIVSEQLSAGGIRPKYDIPPNSGETNRRITRAYSNFTNNGSNGFIAKGLADYADAAIYLSNGFVSGGSSFIGMTPDGKSPEKGDPEIDALTKKVSAEFDVSKAQQMTHEIQRVMAAKAYTATLAQSSRPLTLTWPTLSNLGVFRSSTLAPAAGTEVLIHSWADDSKPPSKKGA